MNVQNDTRTKILAAASKLFQLQGYHATGLNQIIKESGAPKGSLYYHFPDGKEELAEEAIIATRNYVTSILKNTLNKHQQATIAIQMFIKNFANHFGETQKVEGAPIGLLALETWFLSERLRKACLATYEEWQDVFTKKMLEDGLKEERAKELAVVISSMIEGAFVLSATRKDGYPLHVISEQVPILLKN